MIHYEKYVRAKSMDEAYALVQNFDNVILGGMLWLNTGNAHYGTVVDLCDLDLDRIKESGDCYNIYAYVTLGRMETDEALNAHYSGVFKEALSDIEGVQLRNMATVGGTVNLRAGFSDLCVVLLAMNAQVKLYNAGIVSMEKFLTMDRSRRDVVKKIILPKNAANTAYQALRNSKTDIPVLNCAVTKVKDTLRIAVGARPGSPVVVTEQIGDAKEIAEKVAENITFGDNVRGSAEYRKLLCVTLVKRAIEQVMKEGK